MLNRLTALILVTAVAGTTAAGLDDWNQERARVLQMPGLIRYYTFQERQGQFLVDQVAQDEASVYGTNTMTIMSNSPYGQPRTKYVVDGYTPYDYPFWAEGRWPGKGALTTGVAKNSVVRSQFYGTDTGDFSLLLWVRPHLMDVGSYAGGLAHCGSGHKQGWRLQWQVAPWHPEGRVSFGIGVPSGTTFLHGPFAPGVWHCVAVTWAKGNVALYVDGVLKQKEQLEQQEIVWPERPDHAVMSQPYWDTGGMKLGRAFSQAGAARADIDELAVFDRALPAEEVTELYRAGKPDATPEAQIARFRRLAAQKAVRDRIQLTIPHNTYGYFHRDKPIVAKIVIPPANGPSGPHALHLTMVDLDGRTVLDETVPVDIQIERENSLAVPIRQERCGLYWLTMALVDAKGAVVKAREYPLAVIVPLPANRDVPLSSPLACHNMGHVPEHSVLGNKLDRIIRGWRSMEPKKGEFDFRYEDKLIREAEERGMNMLFCIDLRPPAWLGLAPGSKNLPADMAQLERFLRVVVDRYKGRVAYYEIFNEPNAGHGLKGKGRARDYVTFLKLAYRVIKDVDQQAQVAAFSGVHRFRWFEEVMAENPGTSYDVVTLHNYGPLPIELSRDRQLVQKVRKLLDNHGRADAELWNGECGFAQPARVNGRPISDARLQQLKLGAWMPLATERRNAYWQAQAVLLDLADGCDKYFMLSGGSGYSPNFNDCTGTPSEKGIAKAAVSSLLIPSTERRRLPLVSSEQAAVLITDQDGTHTLAAFSLEPSGLTLKVDRNGQFTGMDYLGNPLTWTATDKLLHLPLSEAPVYVHGVSDNVRELPLLRVELDAEKLSAQGRLSGTLTLHNPWKEAIEVELAALLPDDTAIELAETHRVRGREKLRVPFTIDARPLWPSWYRLGFQARRGDAVLARTDTRFYSSGRVAEVPEAAAPIALTADAAGWPADAPVAVAKRVGNVVKGKPIDGVPGDVQWRGPDDLSFSVRTAWHPKSGLHFLLEVTDNAVVVAGKGQHWFFYDCLELFVDTRPVQAKTRDYSVGAQQFLVKPHTGKEVAECPITICGLLDKTVTLKAVGKRTDRGYTIEGLIRPKPGHEKAFGPGRRLHLDFLIDDTDSAKLDKRRKAIVSLHSVHANSSQDASQWGAYELREAERWRNGEGARSG